MIILNIDTSTSICSAAITRNGEVLFARENAEGHNHARMLPVFVEELLAELKEANLSLDAVALSQGPGSYTGLRIGTATAKGIAYGLNIPLLAIDTLRILVEAAQAHPSSFTPHNSPSTSHLAPLTPLYAPMIDARRMEVYTALYDASGKQLTNTEARIIDNSAFLSELDNHTIYFFGDGAAKCKEVITHPNAAFIENIAPLARYMGTLAEEAYAKQEFQDVAYFDPFYLKEYQAVVSKNKIF